MSRSIVGLAAPGNYGSFASSLSRCAAAALALLALAGCDHFDIRDAAGRLPPYQKAVDRPKTIIDRALDRCPDKTEERETGCVKQAFLDAAISIPALIAMLPGCRTGHLCHYDYTTDDRMGYVPAIAAEFVVRWRVEIDLAHPVKDVADVPVTVAQIE